MNDQIADSTPVTGDPTADERAQSTGEQAERQAAAQAFAQADIPPMKEAVTEGYRTFTCAREHANRRFLIPGTPVKAPIVPGTPLGIVPISHREGDVWVRFSNGTLVTKEPAVIEWCEKHPKICRDATDPRTPGWVALKDMQARIATRDATLPGDVDVDNMAFPDIPGLEAALGESKSLGGTEAQAQVESALTAKEKLEKVEQERAADPSRVAP